MAQSPEVLDPVILGSWGLVTLDPNFRLCLKILGNKEISRKWLKWLELKGSAELATKYERLDNNGRKLQKKKKKKKKKIKKKKNQKLFFT